MDYMIIKEWTKMIFALIPFVILIVGLVVVMWYIEGLIDNDDPYSKIAVRFINICILAFITWIIYGLYFLYTQ